MFPFFLGDLVELPVTLAQDHTLWEILRLSGIGVWTTKVDWIADVGGLVNVIVHPDYVDRPERVAQYEALLAHLAGQAGGWHALPRDVAAWWRRRAELRVERDGDGRPVVTGADRSGATVAHARDEGGRIVIEPGGSADVPVQQLAEDATDGDGAAPDEHGDAAFQA